MLAGEAGYFFPGFGFDLEPGKIIASHGSEGNTRLCATCHVVNTTITDAATGEFQFQAVGHGFKAIPCLDSIGAPSDADCALSTTERSFEGCTGAGCHTTVQGVFSAMTTATTRFKDLTTELHALLLLVDPDLEGPNGPINAGDSNITVAEGAFFNMELAEFGGAGRPSEGLTYAAAAAHNPFLMETLLRASINAVKATYPAAAAAEVTVDLSPQLVRPGAGLK